MPKATYDGCSEMAQAPIWQKLAQEPSSWAYFDKGTLWDPSKVPFIKNRIWQSFVIHVLDFLSRAIIIVKGWSAYKQRKSNILVHQQNVIQGKEQALARKRRQKEQN